MNTTERLFERIRIGDLEGVREAIAAGVDVNATDGDGWTPLHWAACCGHAEIVRLLMSVVANVNSTNSGGMTPSSLAAAYGHAEIAQMLISARAEGKKR